jgi:hypothetical protein
MLLRRIATDELFGLRNDLPFPLGGMHRCLLHSNAGFAAECQRMVAQASNPRIKTVLADMACTWTRLALEIEQSLKESRTAGTHRAQSSSAPRRTAGASGFLNLSQSGFRPDL